MASCLGLYIEENIIKYAKVSKDKDVIKIDSFGVKFYDKLSERTITRFEREIMDAEYHLNRNYILRGYAFLNEFYEFLGLPATEYGEEVGWSMYSGINWIDFEHTVMPDKSGKKYLINMIFPPYELEEWEC